MWNSHRTQKNSTRVIKNIIYCYKNKYSSLLHVKITIKIAATQTTHPTQSNKLINNPQVH